MSERVLTTMNLYGLCPEEVDRHHLQACMVFDVTGITVRRSAHIVVG